ncbi:tetratricopeptide repeat protein [Urechidicola sp. KH5]
MTVSDYTYLLQHPDNISEEQQTQLVALIKEFPFLQSARALQLLGLKNSNSIHYNQSLKTTAAYTSDRSVLFDLITSSLFQKTAQQHSINAIDVVGVETIEEAHEALEIGKPLTFNKAEVFSFNEWLQLSKIKPVVREKPVVKTPSKFDLIDRFIANNPKISPVKKDGIQPANKADVITDYNSLMTETLAQIYVEQKKFKNAIKAYEILSLKYPEKSTFFADRIKAIKILENK